MAGETKKVVISGQNLGDGMGDITHILNAGSDLERRFKERDFAFSYVVLWYLFEDEGKDLPRLKQLVEMLSQRGIITAEKEKELMEIESSKAMIDAINQFNPEKFYLHTELREKGLREKFQGKYVITISASSSYTGDIGKNLILLEHGRGCYRETNNVLQKDSLYMAFDDLAGHKGPGIFLEDNTQNPKTNLLSVENKIFKKLVFGDLSNAPNQEDVIKEMEDILNNTILIPTYFIHSRERGLDKVLTAIESGVTSNDNRDILIQGKFNLEEVTSKENIKILRTLGFSKIEFVSKDGDIKSIEIPENKGNKKFKVISGVYFSDHDYNILKKTPSEFFGCSGDNSFQDAISCGALPLFISHPNVPKKEWFIKSLWSLLKKENPMKWALSIKFLEHFDDSNTKENISPELLREWKEVCKFLIKNYNAYDYLEEKLIEITNRTEDRISELIDLNKSEIISIRTEGQRLQKKGYDSDEIIELEEGLKLNPVEYLTRVFEEKSDAWKNEIFHAFFASDSISDLQWDFPITQNVLTRLFRKKELYNLLLKYGMDINSTQYLGNRFGKTILHEYSNDGRNLSILLENGADPNIRDLTGNTALHFASKKGNIKNVLSLLKHGAEPNILNEQGESALTLACQSNTDEDIIIELINGGADSTVVDKLGKPPLDYLPEEKRIKIINALSKNEIDQKSMAEETPTQTKDVPPPLSETVAPISEPKAPVLELEMAKFAEEQKKVFDEIEPTPDISGPRVPMDKIDQPEKVLPKTVTITEKSKKGIFEKIWHIIQEFFRAVLQFLGIKPREDATKPSSPETPIHPSEDHKKGKARLELDAKKPSITSKFKTLPQNKEEAKPTESQPKKRQSRTPKQ